MSKKALVLVALMLFLLIASGCTANKYDGKWTFTDSEGEGIAVILIDGNNEKAVIRDVDDEPGEGTDFDFHPQKHGAIIQHPVRMETYVVVLEGDELFLYDSLSYDPVDDLLGTGTK